MIPEDNAKLIQKLFTLINSGEIPAALELFSDDVEFISPVTRVSHSGITWSRPRKGKAEVGAFFGELNEKAQLKRMNVEHIIAQNEFVVVEGNNGGVARETGKSYVHDWMMIFKIKNGKIISSKHYYDTADIEKVFNG